MPSQNLSKKTCSYVTGFTLLRKTCQGKTCQGELACLNEVFYELIASVRRAKCWKSDIRTSRSVQLYPLFFSAAGGPEGVSLANGNSERADESRNSQQYANNLKTFSKSQESVV